MQLLENTYYTVILNERLQQINLNIGKIKKTLEEEYKLWRQRYGKIPIEKQKQFEMQPEELNVIAAILPALYAYDKRYSQIFQNDETRKLAEQLAATDLSWKNFVVTRIPSYIFAKQPVGLTVVRLLQEMGLVVPIAQTTDPVTGEKTQYPTYPLRLLHKFIQMNILEKDLKMSPEKKRKIEAIVFDDATKKQIQDDIDAYNARTQMASEDLPPQPEEESI